MLLINLNIEFISILFLIIYAGAVSILFIFVVLLFDIKFLLLYTETVKRINFFYFFFFIVFNFLIFFFIKYLILIYLYENIYLDWLNIFFIKNELENLGSILFNYYYLYVFLLIFILFIAIVGVIILSINKYSLVIRGNFLNLNLKKLLLLK